MKKITLILVLVFCLSAWFMSPSDQEENNDIRFTMPGSLLTIEDEAFEGIAAMTVILPDSLLTIGDRSFAEIYALRDIFVPASVEYISELAFEGNANLVIHGEKNSYAAEWATAHDVAFVEGGVVSAWLKTLNDIIENGVPVLLPIVCILPGTTYQEWKRRETIWRSMRPQDRPELYQIDYKFP